MITKQNKDLFYIHFKSKKVTCLELEKRIVTMYLPDHEELFSALWGVLKDCLLITFN